MLRKQAEDVACLLPLLLLALALSRGHTLFKLSCCMPNMMHLFWPDKHDHISNPLTAMGLQAPNRFFLQAKQRQLREQRQKQWAVIEKRAAQQQQRNSYAQ